MKKNIFGRNDVEARASVRTPSYAPVCAITCNSNIIACDFEQPISLSLTHVPVGYKIDATHRKSCRIPYLSSHSEPTPLISFSKCLFVLE